MNTCDLRIAATIRQLENRAAVGAQASRFISPGFCQMCGTQDGMQPLDFRGVEQSKDEDIYTDSTGQMYTPCHHCNPHGSTIPSDYWQAEPHAAMVWAIADREDELSSIKNAAEREEWLRRYEKGSV